MITMAVARVAAVARKELQSARTRTTGLTMATDLATLNRLRSLKDSHTSHKCHAPRIHYANPIPVTCSEIGERVARSISSSIVVRVERVTSPQRIQGLGRDQHDFRVGQCGDRCIPEYAWRSRAPP